MGSAMNASLITVSFRGDLELARDLCASVDEFVDPRIDHVLIVPQGDFSLFKPLEGGRRRVVSSEAALGGAFRRLPFPKRISLPFYSRRMRDIWLSRNGLARGWIAQQLIKLSSDTASARQSFIFADSDIVFVRPLNLSDIVREGRLRLYRRPGATQELPGHRRWHKAAAELLGLPETDYFGADYIGPLVTWRADVLAALHQRLEQVSGKEWRRTLASRPALSEYILYGVFAEHVLKDDSGHYFDSRNLTHELWTLADYPPERLEQFAQEIEDHKIAVLIQSTTDMPTAKRQEIVAEIKTKTGREALSELTMR